jgi:hypothetical protein
MFSDAVPRGSGWLNSDPIRLARVARFAARVRDGRPRGARCGMARAGGLAVKSGAGAVFVAICVSVLLLSFANDRYLKNMM